MKEKFITGEEFNKTVEEMASKEFGGEAKTEKEKILDELKAAAEIEDEEEIKRLQEEIKSPENLYEEAQVLEFKEKAEKTQKEINRIRKEIEENGKMSTQNLKLEKSVENKLSEFNIKPEDLREIKDFGELSVSQQLFVLENLKQVSLMKTEEQAAKKYKEKTIRAGWMGKAWKGITKKYQIAKEEESVAQELQKGGLEIHSNDLKQLSMGMKENNLNIIEKDGKLEIQYIDIADKKLNPGQKGKAAEFNKIATEFSKTSYEWSLETATKEQRQKYQEVKNKYENIKNDILNIEKEIKGSETEAALYMNNIDRKTQYNQFLTANPEVEKTLLGETSKIVVERGLYMAAGFATRTATMSLLGLFGAPLAAAGMGGFMARKRAKESLKEMEIAARRGEKNKKEEAKNFINADQSVEKIDNLINKINEEKNSDKKAELINFLKTRIEYTQDKIDDGLVNFGGEESRLKNQLDIIQALGRAQAVALGNSEGNRTALEERLERFLTFKEEKIEKAQKKYVRDQIIKGVIMGAGFATVGYALRHFAGEWFDWNKKAGVVEASTINSAKTIAEAPISETPLAVAAEIKPEILTIGARGPEGAIIDYFRENPDVAVEKFGASSELVKDGIIQDSDKFNEWAGGKAHRLWLEDAKEMFEGSKKSEIIDNLGKLGYSKDIEGYAQMMRRIGEGGVEIDPETGKINLTNNTEYLKARISAEEPTKILSGTDVTRDISGEGKGNGTDVTRDISGEGEGNGTDVTKDVVEVEDSGKNITNEILNNGKEGGAIENLKKIFGSDILGEDSVIISDRKDGVAVIKNAFGQENFDLLFTSKTVGVDGPVGWNWGSKGTNFGFGDRIPTEKINPGTIEAAKKYIMESAKELKSERFDR